MKTHTAARDFPIVCVGGSAGGLDAYSRLLKHLPNDMGVAIAQKPDTAGPPDMPESAIASGYIDFILSPENIAQEIIRIAHTVRRASATQMG
ncbi:MAG: hypothetical protein A2464_10185 [Deltaproteobacteria bacterium RIFOXYC2_FULL_48_10]|nr:MAG: hypothetical protein A2464_10185 [Deltaproteobacteria bacterium RIFOXYC2_FULL_48_10]